MARPSKSLVPRLGSRRIVAGTERHVWNAAGLVKRTVAGSRGGHPPPAGRSPTEIDARRRQTCASSNTRERRFELARAHGRQLDKLAWRLDRSNLLSAVDGSAPGNTIEAVVDDLVSLAAHRAYVVERDLSGTRSGSRGDDSPPGHDVELRFRVHLSWASDRQRERWGPCREARSPPRCRSFVPLST